MTDMPFQIGSFVECIDSIGSLEMNAVYQIHSCIQDDPLVGAWFVFVTDDHNRKTGGWFPRRFRLCENDCVYPYTITIKQIASGIQESVRQTTLHAKNDADAITQIMRFPDIRNGWILETMNGGRTVASWGYND